ncbi:hypothetical protein PRIPAC_73431 [Pristionchus pacificus]|uniref:C2H2-type domain-containing protein n=1 Tax=Pristionchus pacificus TaxID=54126 RepID=A0A2A6CF48_PRIPA|nr:hypothetical protein PRIPAC_73431 [Pristionchus pacificus]|eukprot:PDM76683.1 hypothetical protein PRIPAC_42078 [Pristionchus pacificus]
MDENSVLSSLRKEISGLASTALLLGSIPSSPIPGNDTISPHWRLFSPICELIKASVEDEKSIAHFVARIDGKVSEMRRRLDPTHLDQVIAYNILQMFSAFVKFMKTLSHMDPSGDSPAEMNGEIERLKNELFNRETELETLKRNHEAIRMGGEMLRDQFNSVFGINYEDDTVKVLAFVSPSLIYKLFLTHSNVHVNRLQVAIPKSKNMIQSSSLTRGKSESQMVCPYDIALISRVIAHAPITAPELFPPNWFGGVLMRTVATTNVLPPLPPLPSFASLLDPSSTPPQYHNSTISNDAMLTLRNILSQEILRNITHGGEREVHFPCPFENCQRTYNKMCGLFEHTKSDHYSEGMMQVQCSSCRDYYDNETSYETHILNCPTAVPIMTMKRWDHDEETNQERADRLALEKKLQTCPYAGCTYVSKSKSRSIFKHMNKIHGNDGRAWYKCTCGLKRRALYTMLFHRYSDCRTGDIEFFIGAPALLKVRFL